MEVKKGYKITEVGVIPNDWDFDKLEKYWNVIDCKHITAKFIDNGIPLASITEVQNLFVDLTNAMQTTDFFYNKLIEGGRKPITGDLIFSRNATVGEVAQVAKWHPPFAMGQDVCLLRKKNPNSSTTFLQAIIKSSIIEKQLELLMVGSTFKRVNIEQIRNLLIPFPSPNEQRAIAAALSDADALLAALERLIAKKKAIKQGAMQELLTGKRRLEGFEGAWRQWRVGNIGYTYSGLTGKVKEDFGVGEGRYITFLNVMNNVKIDTSILEPVNIKTGENQNNVQFGDLFFNTSSETPGEVGMCAVLLENVSNAYLNSFCFGFRLHENIEIEPVYIAYYFRSSVGRSAFYSLAQGATRYNLSKSNFNNITLRLPKQDEQRAIAQILTDMDADIAALEQQRDKYKAVKAGMMQELLTGKTRLI